MGRAVTFYRTVFDAEVVRQSTVMAKLAIAGSMLGIHSDGEGERTWTGLSFQVGDLFAACETLQDAAARVLRRPENTPEEPAHLAMCADTEGNEIMPTVLMKSERRFLELDPANYARWTKANIFENAFAVENEGWALLVSCESIQVVGKQPKISP